MPMRSKRRTQRKRTQRKRTQRRRTYKKRTRMRKTKNTRKRTQKRNKISKRRKNRKYIIKASMDQSVDVSMDGHVEESGGGKSGKRRPFSVLTNTNTVDSDGQSKRGRFKSVERKMYISTIPLNLLKKMFGYKQKYLRDKTSDSDRYGLNNYRSEIKGEGKFKYFEDLIIRHHGLQNINSSDDRKFDVVDGIEIKKSSEGIIGTPVEIKYIDMNKYHDSRRFLRNESGDYIPELFFDNIEGKTDDELNDLSKIIVYANPLQFRCLEENGMISYDNGNSWNYKNPSSGGGGDLSKIGYLIIGSFFSDESGPGIEYIIIPGNKVPEYFEILDESIASLINHRGIYD